MNNGPEDPMCGVCWGPAKSAASNRMTMHHTHALQIVTPSDSSNRLRLRLLLRIYAMQDAGTMTASCG